MFEIPVAFFYTFLFLVIIYKSKFYQINGIGKKWFPIAFLVKIVFGIGNLLIWYYVIGHGDSLNYFGDSKLIYKTLPENPSHFLQLTFGYRNTNTYPDNLRYVSDFLTYSWNNVEYTMVRINALLNILTFGSAFGNVIILAFICFTGSVYLLKIIANSFFEKRTILFIIFFFYPSIIFWSSGLLKEGLAILLVCLLWAQLLQIDLGKKKMNSLKSWLRILFILFLIFLIRDFLLLLIIPNLYIWLISHTWKWKTQYVFISLTFLVVLFLGISDAFFHYIDIANSIQKVQAYFSLGISETDYNFYQLDGTPLSLFEAIPYAINNILFRPNIFHSADMFRIYQSIELMGTWAILILCIFRINKKFTPLPAILFILFFSIELIFIFGLVVMDADTLSRYRTLPIFFLMIVAILFSDKFTQKTQSNLPA